MMEERIRRGRLSGAPGRSLWIGCRLVPVRWGKDRSVRHVGQKHERRAAAHGQLHLAGGALVTVENFGSSVRVVGPEGESLDLPASPSTQRNRYGEASDAIVLEGREALFMRRGDEPLTCIR